VRKIGCAPNGLGNILAKRERVHCAGHATASSNVATQLPKNGAVEQAHCREIA
jgi:hypothetical protein